MTSAYLDASCLLRILLREPGGRAPLGRKLVAASSRVVEVEAARTIDRARLNGHLDDEEASRKHAELFAFLRRLHLVAVSDDVIALARSSFPVAVRALDAIHVATAQVLAGEVGALEFWTHDRRQALAAAARGLAVRGV
jgi:predicted nucleic acid-binding protein